MRDDHVDDRRSVGWDKTIRCTRKYITTIKSNNDFDAKFAKVNSAGESLKDAWWCDFMAVLGERLGYLQEIPLREYPLFDEC
jgi:hypothetical protein